MALTRNRDKWWVRCYDGAFASDPPRIGATLFQCFLAFFPNRGRRCQELFRVWIAQLKAVTETIHSTKQTVCMVHDIIEAHERADCIASFAWSSPHNGILVR